MTIRGKIALLALGVAVALPAQASDKRDFEACDGRIHPGKQDDGMRGEASRSGYSFFGAARGTDIAACDRALASPRLLPTQTLRKAHLLRARAAALLQDGDATAAIADLDLAEATAAGFSGDRFYQRSMGVSLSLLRALALTQSGKAEDAAALARSTIEARPYSLQVQNGAAEILQASRSLADASPSPWLSVARLEPNAAVSAVINEAELGNHASALKLSEGVTLTWPTGALKPYSLMARDPETVGLLSSVIVSLHTAYARAATGDPAGARKDLATLQEKAAPAMATPADAQATTFQSPAREALQKYIELRTRQIEARVAVAEGRTSDAISALVGASMPRDAATIELLNALRAALPPKDALAAPDVAPFMKDFSEQRSKDLTAIIPSLLIAPETPRAVVDYERARPNILGALIGGALSMGTSLLGGIDRTDGFRSTANADGTTKVEFIGNTPSAALVQEMTLLRAAELAKAAGKPAFVIVDRKDFSRTMQTTQYGSVVSSVPTGFKTELTVRFVDEGVDAARALGTVQILDSLGPLYYEEKKKK